MEKGRRISKVVTMNKVLLLVPDGVGIKNYLYSNLFKGTSVSLCLFHNFDDDTLEHIEKKISIDTCVEIPIYKESIKEKFCREIVHLSRLKFNAKKVNNPTILKFWKKGHKSFKLKLFYKIVELIANFIRSYTSIIKVENYYERALARNPFYDQLKILLQEHRPDMIFCTHQRALKAPTIFKVARDLDIPSNTVIYSWDNLPKARLALKADSYFVWSNYMKNELELFYPEIPSDRIKVTGTPQFEFYNDPKNIIEPDTFFRQYGLDPTKKIVCFSGDDVKTSPYDPNYLDDVAGAIKENELDKELQLVFRRCPVDISGRYDWVIKKYPNIIIEIPPLWNFNSEIWSAVYPTYDDVKLLVSLVYYGDLVINLGSTMAFDFGMFQKPCIFINYDHKLDKNWSVNTIYKYQHFRSMPNKNVVYWFDDKNEIALKIRRALEVPHTEIKSWHHVVVGQTKNTTQRILNQLLT